MQKKQGTVVTTLTYPGSQEVIHRSTSGNQFPQRYGTHQGQTGRLQAEGVSTENKKENTKGSRLSDETQCLNKCMLISQMCLCVVIVYKLTQAFK